MKRGNVGYNGFDFGSYRCQSRWVPTEFIGGEIHVGLEGELVEHVWDTFFVVVCFFNYYLCLYNFNFICIISCCR